MYKHSFFHYLFIIITCCLLFSCNSSKKREPFPDEMVKFVPYAQNPLFTGTGGDEWDKHIRERGFILFEDGLFKMWYSGYNNDYGETKTVNLGYATSKDGINWERYPGNPIYEGKWTEDVFVLKEDNLYYLYAENAGDDTIHLLTSSDGIRWEEQGDLSFRTAAGGTVLPPVGTPAVFVKDGKWLMYYERGDDAVWLATSEDKLNWTNMLDTPVLKPGPEKYDQGGIAADQIIEWKGYYYMFYHATANPEWWFKPCEWNSDVAVSSDLINWTKYPDNPIVAEDYSSPIVVFHKGKPILYTMHDIVCRW